MDIFLRASCSSGHVQLDTDSGSIIAQTAGTRNNHTRICVSVVCGTLQRDAC